MDVLALGVRQVSRIARSCRINSTSENLDRGERMRFSWPEKGGKGASLQELADVSSFGIHMLCKIGQHIRDFCLVER